MLLILSIFSRGESRWMPNPEFSGERWSPSKVAWAGSPWLLSCLFPEGTQWLSPYLARWVCFVVTSKAYQDHIWSKGWYLKYLTKKIWRISYVIGCTWLLTAKRDMNCVTSRLTRTKRSKMRIKAPLSGIFLMSSWIKLGNKKKSNNNSQHN